MTPAEKKAEENAKWKERFWNPMVMMAWKAEISVVPACKEKGDMVGWRIYPTGEREMFTVS